MGDNENKHNNAAYFLEKELHLLMCSTEQKHFQTQTARFLHLLTSSAAVRSTTSKSTKKYRSIEVISFFNLLRGGAKQKIVRRHACP
jgi:hypothetical protein